MSVRHVREAGKAGNRALWRTLALAAPAFLGACVLVMTQSQYYGSNVPDRFQYAGAGRDFTTVIVGNPFPVPKEALDRAVTDAMQDRHFGAVTHFTTTPSDNARRKFRIVMMFDPPISLPGWALCGDVSALPPAQRNGRLRLQTAFCAGDFLESEVQASIPRVASPDDPALRDMVGAVMRDILPTRDPGEEDNCQPPDC